MKYSLESDEPSIPESAFVAPSADVIGNVTLGERTSVWFGTVARGDVDSIRIGEETNIQDNSTLHVREGMPLEIGNRVTVGHSAKLHACTIEDEVLVGIGAVVLDDAVLRSHCMIGAGAVVTPGTEVPPGAVYMGSPAQFERNLSESELELIKESARNYVDRTRHYRNELINKSE
ncbi:MAG: gamma carbonic anhydrase family protein [bacterium]